MRSSTTTAAQPRGPGTAGAVTQAEANRLAKRFLDLLTAHRADVQPALRPVAPPPPEPDVAEVHDRHRATATAGLRAHRRWARAAAQVLAERAADDEIAATRAQRALEHTAHQAELDTWWQALTRNDPDVVLAALAAAFGDGDEVTAAPLGVQGSEATLVVLVPPESVIPDGMPELDAAGRPSLRELPMGERSGLYATVVMSRALATVRQAMAAAPGLRSARVMALRTSRPDLAGRPRLDCVLAGRWTRHALDRARWDTADARTVAEDAAAELLYDLRPGRSLRPHDLRAQRDMSGLADVVVIEGLLG